ncbi:MAG TPA: cob(I)yrinic acid a,c-diamide adenosyltransferase [Phycisphaerae bacterium]|nr:cob(I)yrinic acid a,c-diamide adenosyltransferase [Phycisphaerae bacterium]
MAKLYTKVGDDGGTVLFDGTRVRKCDPRVAAYGELDELNAQVGVAIAMLSPRTANAAMARLVERLTAVQNALFSIGAELATPADAKNRDRIKQTGAELPVILEGWIDEACRPLAPLRAFVLPGGDPAAAQLHVCRTVCRRAERSVVSLTSSETLNPQVIIYLNRLSDLFFAWARHVNQAAGVPDVEWHA